MGVISSMRDFEFVKGVMGEDYVAMTEENIANGDPFGIYKNTSEGGYFSTFIKLFYHNVHIDFLMFICGLFFGIFTLAPFISQQCNGWLFSILCFLQKGLASNR